MPEKRKRGRPPKFVRHPHYGGVVFFGVSGRPHVDNHGRTRTRFYATFSKPRKWLSTDDIVGAFTKFRRWLIDNGLMVAYFRKTGQDHLIEKFLASWAEGRGGREYQQAADLPVWLKGRKRRSIPLSVIGRGLVVPAPPSRRSGPPRRKRVTTDRQ